MPDVKPAKTYGEQLAILKARGLVITDETHALHCLTHLNYYRLSAYRFPLTVHGNTDQFLPQTGFGSLWGLYVFDRQMRNLVTEALKRVEISIRARWAYVLGHAYGAQAFENVIVFRDAARHGEMLRKLDEELTRSDEVFVKHYRTKYGMRRPPIWAASEVMSFGLLSRFYANVARDKDRKEIAKTYRFFPETMKSFLEHAVYVRNLCAHHCRLWNRRFTVTLALPDKQPIGAISSLNPAEDRRIYNTLVLLSHLGEVIEPDNTWAERLYRTIVAHPFPVTAHMGFPSDWQSRPMWSRFRGPVACQE